MRYSLGLLVKVTRMAPVNGLPLSLVIALLNLELIGSMIAFVCLWFNSTGSGHNAGTRGDSIQTVTLRRLPLVQNLYHLIGAVYC
jgi:hypothetical protein